MTTSLDLDQVEIRADTDAALVIGRGTAFEWAEDGPTWWNPIEVTTNDEKRSGAHGYTPGIDYRGKHVATLIVTILGESRADIAEKIDAWKAACAIAEGDELVAVRARLLVGETRVRFGRFRIPGAVNAAAAAENFTAIGSAQFEVLDGLTYSDTERSLVTGRVVPGAGIELPAELPWELPESAAGSVNAVNAGTAPGYWRARLTGPLEQPVLDHLESGTRLALTANGGVNLAPGQFLDIDSRRRTVLLNGTADRQSQLAVPPPDRWGGLAVGDNTFRLSADDGAGTLSVFWRDAYHS